MSVDLVHQNLLSVGPTGSGTTVGPTQEPLTDPEQGVTELVSEDQDGTMTDACSRLSMGS